MAYFNVISGNVIIATILAPDLETAKAVSGQDCIEQAGEIGYTWNDGYSRYLPINKYASWHWDNVLVSWVPPVAKPESDVELVWDEAVLNWVEANPEPAPVV